MGNINIWEKNGIISNGNQFLKKYSIFEEIHLGTYLTVIEQFICRILGKAFSIFGQGQKSVEKDTKS